MKRLWALAYNLALSNLKIRRLFKLTYAVTYKCYSRCLHCNIWKRRSTNELSLKDIDNFFRKNNHFSWIDLTGGEIFNRRDLLEIIKIINRRCRFLYLLHFPTSAESILAYKRTVEIKKLMKSRLVITISLDGPQKTHDKIRGLNGSFKRSIEIYRRLKAHSDKKFQVYFGYTLSDYNHDCIDETIESIRRSIPNFKYKELHLNVLNSSRHYYGIRNEIDREKISRSIKGFIDKREKTWSIVEKLETKFLMLSLRFLSEEKTPMSCSALSSSLFMDPYGNIYPCIVYGRKLGNIKEHSYDLKEIFKQNLLKETRNIIVGKKCPNCWTPCEAYSSIMSNTFEAIRSCKK